MAPAVHRLQTAWRGDRRPLGGWRVCQARLGRVQPRSSWEPGQGGSPAGAQRPPACELTLVHRPVSTGVTRCAFLQEKSLPSEPAVRARECGAGFPPRHSFQEEDGRHQHQMLGRAAHAGSSRCRPLAHLCLVFPGGGKGVAGRACGPQHTVCRPRALTSLAPPRGQARGCSQRCWRPRGHCEAGPTTAGLASAPCCPVLPQAQEHRSGD